MKKILSIFIGVMAFCQHSYAYDFYAVASSGQTLYYTITNNSNGNRTVEVTSQNASYPYYTIYPTGDLVIPSSVSHYGTTYSVTSISIDAFYECSGLTSVTISDSVTRIGSYAFRNCTGLISVAIPSSVTTINHSAFIGCSSLTSVTIPNSVAFIDSYVFKNCSSLTSVTIPNSVASIGSEAFYGCSGLTSVTIGDSVASIGSDAFYGCSGLTSVIIPNSVTNIWYSAFNGCSGLTSVTIGNSVTTIRSSVFENCSGLTSITIPNSVTSIGNYAFRNCSGLTSVTIGDSVTSIGSSAFENCSGLTFVNIPNSVTNIGDYAFRNCSGLTSVTIGNFVTTIGASAFYNCSGLTSVTIPNSVTSIGNSAFHNVYHIVYYGIATGSPWGALKMNGVIDGDFVYSDSTKHNLTAYIGTGDTITIPCSVTSIGESAFYNCIGLTSVTIPNSVTSIGSNAFCGCSGLVSVTIGDSVTSIGNYAFRNCSGLTSVTIPNSVTSIGSDAFRGCSGLVSVTIGDSVTSIGNNAFYNCMGLTLVTIPNSVISIGSYTFGGCSGLTSITIGNSVTCIGQSAFCNCTGLTSVTIPSSVTSIGNSAFSNCSGLTSVTIPNSVTSIGSYAFYGCSGLTSVTIPGSVTSIGSSAFYGCSNLTEVWLKPTTPPTLGSASSLGAYSVPLIVPYNSYNAYTSAGTYYTNHPIYRDSIIVTTLVNDTLMGYVTGGYVALVYPYENEIVTLTAVANYGYHFVRWDDNSTVNPLYIVTDSNITRTAIFDFNKYSITLHPDTNIHGSCNGGGNCNYLSERTITATANYGYHFTQWNDGDTNNPRIITLTQDTSFTALFAKNSYNVTVNSSDPARGNVSGDTTMLYLDTVSVAATTNYGYHFTQWSDGNIDNPRVIILTRDTILTAMFAKNSYSITLAVDTSVHGSVTGAGTHEYLDDCTVSAIANYGYHFTVWNDGDTTNPRTITLTQDTTFTALFAKNTYTITAISNDTTKGMVAGNSSVEYLDSVTITAMPNYGYHFTAWNDGNTSNPRTIEATKDSLFTAYFDYNQYSITLNVDTNIHGTVVGSGSYNYLSGQTIAATANYGYHFTVWNDGDTTNPRTITLTQDTTFTALFAKNTYTITAISNDTIKGMVAGNSSVEYLDSVTITAVPNYGYHFTAWNDGNTSNPRTIEATRDSLFTAYFDYNQYSIILNVDTNIHGTVVGSGSYNYLSGQTIAATANYGYHFTAWNDGDTTNPRTITLTQDTLFTALFAKNSYSVSVVSADTIWGNVTGNTTTEYLNAVSIAATANYGYHFLHWNDGDTTNPRVITLTQDTLLTAYFAKNWYSVICISDNETMGYVTGSDTAEYLDSVSLLASSNYGYHFSSWNDGDTNNPRVVCLTQDTSFTALFAKNQYTLTVHSNDEIQGSVSDGGVFDYLDTATIIASASEHYHFVRWDDGNMDNPREYVIVGDAILTAIFAIDTHTVTVTANDIARGMAEATGTEFVYGTPCTVTATAYTGYVFSRWSNGITANPYTFAVLEDTELTAIFEEEGTQGIDAVFDINGFVVYCKGRSIYICGIEGQPLSVYGIDGRIIVTKHRATEQETILAPSTGVFFIKVGEYPARKVVVVR